jgi:hypothetical protein
MSRAMVVMNEPKKANMTCVWCLFTPSDLSRYEPPRQAISMTRMFTSGCTTVRTPILPHVEVLESKK